MFALLQLKILDEKLKGKLFTYFFIETSNVGRIFLNLHTIFKRVPQYSI